MTPTFLPVARVAGMIASIPNWICWPDQMMPGLIVPMVCSPKRPVVGDEKLNSTRGVKPIDPFGKAEIANLGAQIQHAVFDCEPVHDLIGVMFDIDCRFAGIRVGVVAPCLFHRRDRVSDGAGQRQRPEPLQRFREIAGPLSEQECRRVGREGVGPDASCARPAQFGVQRHRGHRFVRRIRQELPLQPQLDVLPAARVARRALLTQVGPARPEREADIRCNPFRKFTIYVGLLDRRVDARVLVATRSEGKARRPRTGRRW